MRGVSSQPKSGGERYATRYAEGRGTVSPWQLGREGAKGMNTLTPFPFLWAPARGLQW